MTPELEERLAEMVFNTWESEARKIDPWRPQKLWADQPEAAKQFDRAIARAIAPLVEEVMKVPEHVERCDYSMGPMGQPACHCRYAKLHAALRGLMGEATK
jgi:hypothetical protein